NPNPLDPANPTAPTRARFDLLFNADGSVNAADSEFTISNWQPLGPDGRPNGAAGPNNAGLITEPPTTSNFRVDMTRLTQYGSPFSVSDMQQNGFTTG